MPTRYRYTGTKGNKQANKTGKYGATLLSQTAKAMLLGSLIATAGLWIFIMTVAMGYVAFRM
jgi:hypothetical protein